MNTHKLHSPWPYFLLTALLGLTPVLNNKYPSAFFPAAPEGLVDILCVMLGICAAAVGFSRGWNLLHQRSLAKALLRQAVEKRKAQDPADPGEVSQAGRIISRLVRNVGEDLKEIGPDFTETSLKRLQGFFPILLGEIEDEEDAQIRLGVVGTYLGETACRTLGWQWYFQADPTLRQFSYSASLIRKNGKDQDPYRLAADWMTGKKGLGAVLKAVE